MLLKIECMCHDPPSSFSTPAALCCLVCAVTRRASGFFFAFTRFDAIKQTSFVIYVRASVCSFQGRRTEVYKYPRAVKMCGSNSPCVNRIFYPLVADALSTHFRLSVMIEPRPSACSGSTPNHPATAERVSG